MDATNDNVIAFHGGRLWFQRTVQDRARSSGNVVVVRHAQERMTLRDIALDEVLRVLRYGTCREDPQPGHGNDWRAKMVGTATGRESWSRLRCRWRTSWLSWSPFGLPATMTSATQAKEEHRMTPKWVIQPLTSAEEAKGAGWHHYTESGLDNVWLDGGVKHHKTTYGPGVSIDDVDGLDAVIANWIVERKSYWSGRELRFLRKRLDLSQKGLADLLGYSDQQVRRWEKEEAEMPSPASRLLRLLVREWETKAEDRAPEFMRGLLEHAVEADGLKVVSSS